MSHDQTHQATHPLPEPEKSSLGPSDAPAQLMTREEARALGLKRYFTGLACRNGHVAPRYVSTGNCVGCAADHKDKNLEAVRARDRAYRRKSYARLKAAARRHNG